MNKNYQVKKNIFRQKYSNMKKLNKIQRNKDRKNKLNKLNFFVNNTREINNVQREN